MNRRTFLFGTAGTGIASTVWLKPALAAEVPFLFHDARGNQLLRETLDVPSYWSGADETKYPGSPYDSIRIQNDDAGIVTFITGTGNSAFTPDLVADTIFQHQDIIPTYMSRLKVGEYLGRGRDLYNGHDYTDMFFLADIKIFYMSVPLRTAKISLGDGRFLCPIELVTESMVSPNRWEQYTNFMKISEDALQAGWTIFPVVPMEYLVGYYLIEPEPEFGARVTMVTRLKFKEDVSWVADWGSELPIVLRQGMIAGFMGSVNSCQHLLREGKTP